MVRVVIHNSYGGFTLSYAATRWLAEKGDPEARAHLADYPDEEEDFFGFDADSLARHDPLLIECVETLGEAAGENLVIRTLKNGNRYIIEEYDGWESITEPEDIHWITV